MQDIEESLQVIHPLSLSPPTHHHWEVLSFLPSSLGDVTDLDSMLSLMTFDGTGIAYRLFSW